jgi:hypothetical protein
VRAEADSAKPEGTEPKQIPQQQQQHEQPFQKLQVDVPATSGPVQRIAVINEERSRAAPGLCFFFCLLLYLLRFHGAVCRALPSASHNAGCCNCTRNDAVTASVWISRCRRRCYPAFAPAGPVDSATLLRFSFHDLLAFNEHERSHMTLSAAAWHAHASAVREWQQRK